MPKLIKEVLNVTRDSTPDNESWFLILYENGQTGRLLVNWDIRREQNKMNRIRGASLFKKHGPRKPKSKMSAVNERLNHPSFKDLGKMPATEANSAF